MKFEEVVSGFRALRASDFDYMNVDAGGPERLAELTDALMLLPDKEKAIPELFDIMERLPDAELGSPGPLVHTLERLHSYEPELVRSVRRRPSLLSVWMVNRILNTALSDDARRMYLALLQEAANDRNAPETVRLDARRFVELQRRKA
jgi:hypothetical protein